MDASTDDVTEEAAQAQDAAQEEAVQVQEAATEEAAEKQEAGNIALTMSSLQEAEQAGNNVPDNVRRSPRIAKRVKNPRKIMEEFLAREPPETVSRMQSPRSTASPAQSRSPARSPRAPASPARSPRPPASPARSHSPHIGSPHGTVDTWGGDVSAENEEEGDEREESNASEEEEAEEEPDDDDDYRPTQSYDDRRRQQRLFHSDSDDADSNDDNEGAFVSTRIPQQRKGKTRPDQRATKKKIHSKKPVKAKRRPVKPSKTSESSDEDDSSDFGTDRVHLPIPKVSPTPIPVPALKETHDTWEEFYEYLKEYATSTHQAIRKVGKLTVKARNLKIAETSSAKQGLKVRYIPDEWVNYMRGFICTHGWKARYRGTGKRPQRYERSIACPFKFSVYVRHAGGNKWRLVVESSHYYHNHEVKPEVYKTYAENRGIADPVNRVKAEAMIENKRSRKHVYNWLLEQGENVIMKDVENMIYKFKSAIKREDDDTECLAVLASFTATDKNNVVTIDETSQLETGVISMTSVFMNEMLERFSEILLVDCSHKTNRMNYQLLTLMAIDDYGAGQVVQHSLLERNADWHMSKALDHFVRANPGVAEKVQVLMVDKDLNEIKVLRTYFPNARVLICVFHVIKYLKHASRKPEYGKISSEDHDTLDAIMNAMVYADTKEVYNENYKTLRDVCLALGYEAFIDYFDKNWHSCIDMWVLYTRLRLPHLRVHTNNHLESFFGHFKKEVKPAMSMAETVTALVQDDRARANEYAHSRAKIGCYRNAHYDEHLNHLLRFTNPFVATSVKTEYQLAGRKLSESAFTFTTKELDRVVLVAGRSKTHELNHAIAYRKQSKYDRFIPLEAVGERWLGAVARSGEPPSDQLGGQLLFAPFEIPERKRKRTTAEKYREATRATEAICSELAQISDDDEYDEFLQFVIDQWRNVRQRKRMRTSESVLEASDGETGAAQPPLSQPHSLFSEELGHIPLAEPHLSPAVGDLFATSQPSSVSEAAQPSVYESSYQCGDSDFEPTQPTTAKVALNPRAAKSGRPPSNKDQQDTKAHENRVLYKEAKEVRRVTGEVTIIGVATSVEKEEPPLQDLGKRLDGLHEKHADSVQKQPKFVKRREPVLNVTAFYLIHPDLLKKCFAVLPVANKDDEAIVVSSQSQETSASQNDAERGRDVVSRRGPNKDEDKVECVQIAGVGMFSRKQIEAMGYLQNLKEETRKGEKMLKWLRNKIPAALFDVKPADIAEEIASHFPYTQLSGLQGGFKYSCVYVLAGKQWLNDDTIAALCTRMVDKFPRTKYVGFLSRKSRRPRGRKVDLEPETKARLTAAALDDQASTLLLPVNIDSKHWTLILIKLVEREIVCYDSLTTPDNVNTMKDIAEDIGSHLVSIIGAPGFKKKHEDTPQQFDGHSCGVLVCFKIAQTLDPSLSADTMSEVGLTKLRYRLLSFVLRGILA